MVFEIPKMDQIFSRTKETKFFQGDKKYLRLEFCPTKYFQIRYLISFSGWIPRH